MNFLVKFLFLTIFSFSFSDCVEYLDEQTCAAAAECEWHADEGACEDEVHCDEITDATACGAAEHCEWHADEGACEGDDHAHEGDCATLDQAACESSSDCDWHGNHCDPVSPVVHCDEITDATACAAAAECEWHADEGACEGDDHAHEGDCATLDQAACESSSDCDWHGNHCDPVSPVVHCDEITDATACAAAAECEWHADEGACEDEVHCDEITDATACGAAEHCEWHADEGACEGDDHAHEGDCATLDQAACESSSDCDWHGNHCDPVSPVVHCDEITDATACAAAAECEWHADEGACEGDDHAHEGDCATLDQAACESSSDCDWHGNHCDPVSPVVHCDEITDATACAAAAECEWHADEGACEDEVHCDEITDATACGAAEHCEWHADEGACEGDDHAHEGDCATLDQAACESSSDCDWHGNHCDPVSPVVHCDEITDATACGAAEHCEWHADEGACEGDDHAHEGDCATLDQAACESSSDCDWHGNHCDPVSPVDCSTTNHAAINGFKIEYAGSEVYRQFEGFISEAPLSVHVNETKDLSVHFLTNGGAELEISEDLLHCYPLVFNVTDPNIISVEVEPEGGDEDHDHDHGDGEHDEGLVFELKGLAEGSTTFVMEVWHIDHADFTSFPIAAIVEDEVHCDEITDATACGAAEHCEWHADEGACEGDDHAHEGDCATLDQAACESSSDCDWHGNHCDPVSPVVHCDEITDATACGAAEHCEWHADEGACEGDDHAHEGDCATLDQAACESSSDCDWHGNHCDPVSPVVHCDEITDATACGAAEHCEWHADEGACEGDDHAHEGDCATLDQAACESSSDCDWHGNHCDPVSPVDCSTTNHAAINGFKIEYAGSEVYRQFEGFISEAPLSVHVNETKDLSVHFLTNGGAELEISEDLLHCYPLVFNVTDPNIISVEVEPEGGDEDHDHDHGDGEHDEGLVFELKGLAEGSTTFVMEVWHIDHADFTSFPIAAIVEDEVHCDEITDATACGAAEHCEWHADEGACEGDDHAHCIAGDVNGDEMIDVLDIVEIVYIIVNQGDFNECADYNNDAAIDVLDVVGIVDLIVGARTSDASSAVMKTEGNLLSISGNGYIGAVQMTLTHDANFSLELTSDAMVAEYATVDNTTTLVVVAPESDAIFTASGSYDIESVLVANSSSYVTVTEPGAFVLEAAYPNPFNPSTSVSLSMPAEGYVSVKAYNLVGQVVGVIAEGSLDAGVHTMTWDASDLSSGVYLITAEYAGQVSTQKVMLIK